MYLKSLLLALAVSCSGSLLAAELPASWRGHWSPDCAEDEALDLGMYALELDGGYVRIGFSECSISRLQPKGQALALDLACQDYDGEAFVRSVVWRLEGRQRLHERVPAEGTTTTYQRCR